MEVIKTSLVVGLFMTSIAACPIPQTWAGDEIELKCKSMEVALSDNGVGLAVYISHVLYPIAVQSQGCDASQKISDADYEQILASMFVAMTGCAIGTAGYNEFLDEVRKSAEGASLADADISQIPARHISFSPKFCESADLLNLKKCAGDNELCLVEPKK